jgi:hypothetical protein
MRFTRKEWGGARLPPGKPMRTIGELAEEFGIPMARLRYLLKVHDGPDSHKTGCSNSFGGPRIYYRHDEAREWYTELLNKLKEKTND